MTESTPLPDQYWHCYITLLGDKKEPTAVVNDLAFADLQRLVIEPWHRGVPFPVAGTIVHGRETLKEIRIAQTPHTRKMYADVHYARSREAGILDGATDTRLLPFLRGTDRTHQLLFETLSPHAAVPDVELVLQVCRRLPVTARALTHRDRSRSPFVIGDEYDVQDLLHAVLRAYLKYAVTEEPLGKVGGSRSGRADLALEDLGTIIEVKYARGPRDQHRLVEEFAHDVQLYVKWPHLQFFVYFVYNSADLRDPEALERLGGDREVDGKRFRTFIVLA